MSSKSRYPSHVIEEPLLHQCRKCLKSCVGKWLSNIPEDDGPFCDECYNLVICGCSSQPMYGPIEQATTTTTTT